MPKPEQKLTPKDGALEIVLTVEGEKEPYTLTVGGPSDKEGFYARSNKLIDEIFIVPKANFEQIKKMPAFPVFGLDDPGVGIEADFPGETFFHCRLRHRIL